MLTTDEIMAMPAGRELDALVAQLMGWRWWHKEDYALLVNGEDNWPANTHFSLQEGKGQATGLDTGNVPHYSTDISAAWQVIERLKERGHTVAIAVGRTQLWHDHTQEIAVGVDLEISGYDGSLEAGIVMQADTLPLAICRAALAATGGGE